MIRVLIYVCAFLMLANAIAFFWPDQANRAPHVYSAQEDLNPHFLRLNKEIEDRFYSQPAIEVVAPMNEDLATLDLSSLADSDCYRIGPFMHRPNYELAEAVLLNANVKYQKTKRVSKESNVYRVYLGPYASAAEVSDVRTSLRRANVLDHFVRKEAEGQYIVSLGIYTTKETANDAVLLFDGKLDNVKLKDEVVVLPDSFWLFFTVVDNEAVKAQLAQMDWGEQSTKMGKHQCQN